VGEAVDWKGCGADLSELGLRNMEELKDVVDEFIPLEDVFFPEDKTQCAHVALDGTFIPIVKNNELKGCIMKCANCGELIEYHCLCGVGAYEEDPETGQICVMHACDLAENQKFLEGVKKWEVKE